MMKIKHYILLTPLFVLIALLTASCSNDGTTDNEQPLPEGLGRIRITICTPEANPDLTRAVGSPVWEDPDQEWEWLHSYRILICNTSNVVVQVIPGDAMNNVTSTSYPYKQSAELVSDPLEVGSYNIYALANFADYSSYAVNSTIDPDATICVANGYSETNIPMTGKLDAAIPVVAGQTKDAGTIIVWRVLSKLQFEFTNEASEQIQIMGIEVDPINQINTGDDAGKGLVYLFSKDDLTSEANLAANGGVTLPTTGVTTGSVSYEIPSSESPETLTPLLTLAAYSGSGDKPKGTLFFYVNETAATFTTTNNQYSLRFKIKRGGTISELRYGVTTEHNGSTGGFNVIRRNDWIHIPIVLTDWQLRIEPLAFVPIAGYPATTVSSDGLTATFSTGGMIALQPFIKKYDDSTWRDFGDPDVTFVSVSWKNSEGTDVSGDNKIVKTPFAYDPVTKCIIGELNNDKSTGTYMTTMTVNVTLKSSNDIQYYYSFTFNITLQKENS